MTVNKTKIIAEAGVNHDGKLNLALKLVRLAKKSNADFVKFQAFDPNLLCTVNAKKAKYQIKSKKKESQLELLKKLSLSKEDIHKINNYCKKIKIGLMFSVFDKPSYDVIQKLKHKYIKLPSGEINNFPLIKSFKKDKSKIIFSTGLSNINEINYCYKILRKQKKNSQIIIMHCNTEYPTPLDDVNLKVIPALKKRFKCKVGFSDHSTSLVIPSVAVALGANYIEKHFTHNKNSKGPDHKASLEPKQFFKMVENIRNVERSLGSSEKKVTKSEKKNLKIVRKSIVAKEKIYKGEKFTEENIITKRPYYGLSPLYWNKLLSKRAKRNYNKDDYIKDE